MLSRLSKLATKQILRNVKCKNTLLRRVSTRTFFTSLQQCQKHAQTLSNSLRPTKTNDYSEAASMIANNNFQFNLSNVEVRSAPDFVTLQKHFAERGTVPQIVAQVYRWTSHSYAMFYLSRFIDYSTNREAISSGVGILSVNDSGEIISLGYNDSGSLGPMDELMDMEVLQEGEKPFFDTFEKAQEWTDRGTQLLEDDVNNNRCGNNGLDSQFYNEYFVEDAKLLSANLVLEGNQIMSISDRNAQACSSSRYNTQLISVGDYSTYATFQWSHVYNDGTHGTYTGDQITYVNNDGKIRAVHMIMEPQGVQTHMKKVEEILSQNN